MEWQRIYKEDPPDLPYFLVFDENNKDEHVSSYAVADRDTNAWSYYFIECGAEYCQINPTHWAPLSPPKADECPK